MTKTAIMGFGTVGSGVYEIISGENFAQTSGEAMRVKHILDLRDFDEPKGLFTKNFDDILKDDEVTVVAEAMGGLHPAYEFTRQLLESGKSVVTSNKELVATYGAELLKIAAEHNVNYLFEASVGGGIPIIRPLSSCLKANRLQRIAGILNGTTNYILTEMLENGKSFDDALKDAQEKGYAERNPAADIEGHDACRKIAILSSMAWGKFVDYSDIPTEGITGITSEDVAYAEKIGSVIKLIGYADINSDEKIYARVAPFLIDKGQLLAGVNGVFNAVSVRGDALGDAMFYGRGAGKLPTASAVVADMIDCAKHLGHKKHNIIWGETSENIMLDADLKETAMLVRCRNTEAEIKQCFGKAEIISGVAEGENAFITPEMKEGELKGLLSTLNTVSAIRILK